MLVGVALFSASCASSEKRRLEANKELAIGFFTEVFVGGEVAAIDQYIGDSYIQHNPNVPDGRDVIGRFIEKRGPLPADALIIKRVVAENDLVFLHSHAQFFAKPRGAAVVDIFRIEGGKIVEHWDVIQPVPEEMAHENGMF